ncbi:hypothetical protein ANACAC_01154 [Anaerostipes caccae L1-92]|uniref:Uncharacterized protein n=1 Tax=Anaerostipes caccae (strain DSM 14662 / CCUG 47493 / JCM 13470 / NCIMB 13811 / L1-92) TaxID=411490 RepID=B0MC63_ANACD|nr:hypothetical protein ANACAC_01154 [Anaerostipes caccae L1-92]
MSSAGNHETACGARPSERHELRCALWVYFGFTFHIVLIV